jgi:hypothetical protein
MIWGWLGASGREEGEGRLSRQWEQLEQDTEARHSLVWAGMVLMELRIQWWERQLERQQELASREHPVLLPRSIPHPHFRFSPFLWCSEDVNSCLQPLLDSSSCSLAKSQLHSFKTSAVIHLWVPEC